MTVHKILLGLALTLAAATTSAGTPAPSIDPAQHFDLCKGRLRGKIEMKFGQTATTATVRVRSSAVTLNPFVPGSSSPTPMDYSVFVAASVKKNASAPWSVASTQQDGIIGVAQPDISIGHSTFKDPTCQIKGTVILSSACPTQSNMARDSVTIERNWVGCGL